MGKSESRNPEMNPGCKQLKAETGMRELGP